MHELMEFFVSYLNRPCQSLLWGGFLNSSPLNTIIKVFLKSELYPYIPIKSIPSCEKKYRKELLEIYRYIELALEIVSVCNKNKTCPERLKAYASLGSDKQLCIYTFGAFRFRPVQTTKNIKRRKGAGAIYRHSASFKYCNFFLPWLKKGDAIVSCTFAVSFLCTKRGKVPKRLSLRTNVSPKRIKPFFFFAFGAFPFWHLLDIQNIDGRKGAGAISLHLICFKYWRSSSSVTIKRNAIVSCTFAVFLSGIISALIVCVIQARKESKGGVDVYI